MDGFAKRLIGFISYLGVSNYKFANDIGISQALISKLTTNDDVSFRVDFLTKILAKYPELNINWLLTGSGVMTTTSVGDENNIDPERDIIVSEWLAGKDKSKIYGFTKQVSNSILNEHKKEIELFFKVLNSYWASSMTFIQFVNQFDKYFMSHFHFEVFLLAKQKGFDKEQLQQHLSALFSELQNIIPVIENINTALNKSFKEFKKSDLENALSDKKWERVLNAAFYGDDEEEIKSRELYDLIEKIYPDYLPAVLK